MEVEKRPRIPRGLKHDGLALWSYGFRPFFLGGAIWATLAMVLWLASLMNGTPLGGGYGALLWHAHEMVFGFAPAILTGFLLTLLPNWSGHLPVSGAGLMGMVALWAAGRLAMLGADWLGAPLAAAIDALFLPVLLLVAAREIVTGKKWNDFRLLGAIAAIMIGNGGFHLATLFGGDPLIWARAGAAGYVALVMVMGGRLIPSFTRNWLKRNGRSRMPVALNRYDRIVVGFSVLTLALWLLIPDTLPTLIAGLIAAGLNLVRLVRWRGWEARHDGLILNMHLAFCFVPLGFLAIAATAGGFLPRAATLHVLTVGVIGGMMLSVMIRTTRSHTGQTLTASRMTTASCLSVFLAGLMRPLADLLGQSWLMEISGMLWILGFGLFVFEYGPVLVSRRRRQRGD